LTLVALVGRDAKRLWWRVWWGLAESAFGGSLESGGRFCVSEFGGNLASVAANMFSYFHIWKGSPQPVKFLSFKKVKEVSFGER
jgi:hypothetical protein